MACDKPKTPLPLISNSHRERMTELFEQRNGDLIGYISRKLRRPNDAEDIASHAWLRMLERATPKAIRDYAAYLYVAARNLATEENGYLSKWVRISRPEAPESDMNGPRPDLLLAEHQRSQLLQRAIESLPTQQRLVLILRFWDQLTYPEIVTHLAADGIHICAKTAKRYYIKAIAHCKREILRAEGVVEQDGQMPPNEQPPKDGHNE
jgi:RNA polymerase sigma-70 factor (ECF subfamily)